MKENLRVARLFITKVARVLWASAYAFVQNQDALKASALTLYSLMSLVPFLAVAFGIAAGFGFEDYLEVELKNLFQEQKTAMGYAIEFARHSLQTAKGSVIAGVGLLALLWANLSMFSSIENALNEIWWVKQPRTWSKRFTDYIAVMIICPIFFVVSSSLSVYLITQLTETARDNRFLEWVSPYILLLLRAGPYCLSILLFMVIYTFLPNVKVRLFPRLITAILAGAAFQLWQWIYIRFQVEISAYGAIYGTLAALPLFLIWLQVSWMIVLGGAEIAAHFENEWISVYGPNQNFREVSYKKLGLLILQNSIHSFYMGEPPTTAQKIVGIFGISLLTAQRTLDLLEESGLLVEVTGKSRYLGYHPSKDARLFTLKDVCNALEEKVGWKVTIKDTPELAVIESSLQEFDQLARTSSQNFDLGQLNVSRSHDVG